MGELNKEMIGRLTKEGRVGKGYSQQELSEKTGISLRSVQRIEQGQVMPRPYTIRMLAEHLGFADKLKGEVIPEGTSTPQKDSVALIRKIILSVGTGLVLFFLTVAYLSQSVKFPETQFELFLLIAGVLAFYVIVIYIIWRR